jgi:thiamine biosynthesis lipoprotein
MRSPLTLVVIGSLSCVSAVPARVADRQGPLIRHEGSRVSMGCTYAIAAYGPDAHELPRIVELALDEVDRIDRLMSHYKPDSPLSRLNREAAVRPVTVESELFDFLAGCLRYARDSLGAFDVTVGPLMKAWGFFRGEGRVPGGLELSEVRGRIGYQHIIMDPKEMTVRFDRPGVELDLGGIAKGYAVDRVVRLLEEHGVVAALVSAGGSTLYGLRAPPGAESWEVKVRDPIDGQSVAFTARLRDRALSVSGSREKSFEIGGVRYSHIMDPATGMPVQGVLGVAVLTGSGTAGDALDNAFYVQGPRKAGEYLKRLPPTEVHFFLPAAEKKWKRVRLSN